MIPVVVYAAKSTQDKHDSIPEQLADCREMASENGWSIVGEYSDEGFSAYSGNRGPGLASARDHAARIAAQTGEVCMLVAQHSDRISRGGGDKPGAAEALIEVWHAERRRNVHLRSVEDDFDLGSSATVANIGERNRADSERKSKAVKKGMRRRARDRGLLSGGPRPFGYRWVGPSHEKTLVIVEAEAVIVRRIYAEYVAGKSQRQIVRDMNAEGLRTQRGSEWVQGTVAKVLGSPVYAGRVRHDGEVYDGEHEPIIDPGTWRKAEQLRAATARTVGRGRRTRAEHLLANGLLRCGSCGAAMGAVTKPTKTPGRLYEVYECAGRRDHGLDHCSQMPVKREPIDTAVWRFFERVALDVDATKAAVAEMHDSKLAEIAVLREQAERDAIRATERLTRIRRDYTDGKIDADDWRSFRDELTAELEAAQAQAERLDAQQQTLTQDAEQIDAEAAVIEKLTALRAIVTGQAREGRREGIESFRAALRRVFAAFELIHWPGFGKRAGSIVWQGESPMVGEYVLLPYIADEALDLDAATFPALRKVALTLCGNDAKPFATKSSAPRSKPRIRSSSLARPDRTTSGRNGSIRETTPSAPRTRPRSSSPDPSGSPRSTIARSGRPYSSSRRPSRSPSANTSS